MLSKMVAAYYHQSSKKMKKTSLLLLLLSVFTAHVFAQDQTDSIPQKKGFDKDRLFLGGNFGAGFGDFTQIIVSPQVGYRFSQFFAAGVGVNLQYVSQKSFDQQGNPFFKQSQSVFGANLFARAYPIRQAFIQIQPEFNFNKGKFKYYNSIIPEETFRSNAPSLLVGAGIGMNGGFIALNYDLLQNPNSPYSNTVFVSVGFGF